MYIELLSLSIVQLRLSTPNKVYDDDQKWCADVSPTRRFADRRFAVAQLAERRSLAGELTLSYARPAADG